MKEFFRYISFLILFSILICIGAMLSNRFDGRSAIDYLELNKKVEYIWNKTISFLNNYYKKNITF
ncbi:MAG: hypothetical protein DCC88_03610 [Spirobacillus cienkowskii]|uniref:Uncharacterized protein n=1 Tax=Spirobacillus cienkowskii TaxID=495820 RepID=A0A369KYB9_9BACT|nr:MAG: hypothetical protein DCC88_03610 [Spirobacillus cienkowskii]